MDATIVEVAFHDSVEDAAIMRDPLGRDQIARSMYQGTVQYFATYGASSPDQHELADGASQLTNRKRHKRAGDD